MKFEHLQSIEIVGTGMNGGVDVKIVNDDELYELHLNGEQSQTIARMLLWESGHSSMKIKESKTPGVLNVSIEMRKSKKNT